MGVENKYGNMIESEKEESFILRRVVRMSFFDEIIYELRYE